MMERTIYKKPVGWAERLTGTRRRYLLSSFMTVLAGGVLMYFSVSPSWSRGTWLTTVSSVMVFVCAVELPLYYLRALRALLKEGRN